MLVSTNKSVYLVRENSEDKVVDLFEGTQSSQEVSLSQRELLRASDHMFFCVTQEPSSQAETVVELLFESDNDVWGIPSNKAAFHSSSKIIALELDHEEETERQLFVL